MMVSSSTTTRETELTQTPAKPPPTPSSTSLLSSSSSNGQKRPTSRFSSSHVCSVLGGFFALVRSGRLLPLVFSSLGRLVATYPLRTILVTLVLTVICALGFVNFATETNDTKLFTPQESEAYEDKEWVDANFQAGVMLQEYYAVGSETGQNVLTVEALMDLFAYGADVANVGKANASIPSYEEVCVRLPSTGSCFIESVLGVWNYNPNLLVQDEDIMASINGRIRAEMDEQGDSRTRRMLGGVQTTIVSGDREEIVAAGATRMKTAVSLMAVSDLLSGETDEDGDDDEGGGRRRWNSSAVDGLRNWELDVVRTSEEYTAEDNTIDVYAYSFFALDAEASATLSADLWKLMVRDANRHADCRWTRT